MYWITSWPWPAWISAAIRVGVWALSMWSTVTLTPTFLPQSWAKGRNHWLSWLGTKWLQSRILRSPESLVRGSCFEEVVDGAWPVACCPPPGPPPPGSLAQAAIAAPMPATPTARGELPPVGGPQGTGVGVCCRPCARASLGRAWGAIAPPCPGRFTQVPRAYASGRRTARRPPAPPEQEVLRLGEALAGPCRGRRPTAPAARRSGRRPRTRPSRRPTAAAGRSPPPAGRRGGRGQDAAGRSTESVARAATSMAQIRCPRTNSRQRGDARPWSRPGSRCRRSSRQRRASSTGASTMSW